MPGRARCCHAPVGARRFPPDQPFDDEADSCGNAAWSRCCRTSLFTANGPSVTVQEAGDFIRVDTHSSRFLPSKRTIASEGGRESAPGFTTLGSGSHTSVSFGFARGCARAMVVEVRRTKHRRRIFESHIVGIGRRGGGGLHSPCPWCEPVDPFAGGDWLTGPRIGSEGGSIAFGLVALVRNRPSDNKDGMASACRQPRGETVPGSRRRLAGPGGDSAKFDLGNPGDARQYG